MGYTRNFVLIILCCAFGMGSDYAHAQQTGSKEPVEISAVETLEWDRAKNQYIARGAVEVQQGDLFLTCDTLTADYAEDAATGKTSITMIYAEGNVVLRDSENTAYGDHGTYDVNGGYAKLTGSNLKMVTPEQTITARDVLEYWRFKGEASAVGNAKVDRGEDIITADKITAFFSNKAAGSNSIDQIDAYNNVKITTPDEILTGDNGTYNAANDTASLIGNVTILRGPNELHGARAEVNLTTNISKMFAQGTEGAGDARGADGRVRGVFFPGSGGNSEAPQSPTPQAPAPAPSIPRVSAPNEPVKAAPELQPVEVYQIPEAQNAAPTPAPVSTPTNTYVRPSRQVEQKAKEAGSAFHSDTESDTQE